MHRVSVSIDVDIDLDRWRLEYGGDEDMRDLFEAHDHVEELVLAGATEKLDAVGWAKAVGIVMPPTAKRRS
jgi:hypothetical protein